MSRPVTLSVIALSVLVAAGLLLLVMPGRNEQSQRLVPASTASPTVHPDRARLELHSGDLASKFTTYDRPNDPNYYGSVRPYVTDRFFEITVAMNERYAAIGGDVPVVRSTARSVEVTSLEDSIASARITVETVEPQTGQRYEQVLIVQWVKENNEWRADNVIIDRSTRKGRF